MMKIKEFTVIPYQDAKIKIKKDENQVYRCDGNYDKVIEISNNVFKGRKEYSDKHEAARFDFCQVRLPRKDSY